MRLPPGAGLCGLCRWRRVVQSGKGSVFHLCERSKVDPTLPKYPRIPVFLCHGFEAATAEEGGRGAGPERDAAGESEER